MLTPDKIIKIFVKVDDFCKEFETEIAKHQLDAGITKLETEKHRFQQRDYSHSDRFSQRPFHQSQTLLSWRHLYLLQGLLSRPGVL